MATFKLNAQSIADYRLDVTLDNAKASIGRSFPINSIELFSSGLSNVVFRVNDEYIFRFPRHEKAERSLQVELKVLPLLIDKLSVTIPQFTHVGERLETNFHFVGYKIIPGVALAPETLFNAAHLPNPQLTNQIASFFAELHQLDVGQLRKTGLAERNLKEVFETQLHNNREHVFPLLQKRFSQEAERMIETVETAFASYLNEPKNFSYVPTLIHGDLEKEHILIDPTRRVVTGIIDFGSMRIEDPDYDLWRPYFHFGRVFIDQLLHTYRHPHPAQLYQKMEFFWTAQVCYRVFRALTLNDLNNLEAQLPIMKARLLGQVG